MKTHSKGLNNFYDQLENLDQEYLAKEDDLLDQFRNGARRRKERKLKELNDLMELELQGAASDDEKEAIKQRYAEMAKNVEMEFELDELAFHEQIKAEMDNDKQKEKEIILRTFVTDAARNKSEYCIKLVA